MSKKKLKFEECIEIIDQEINKRRGKWTLTAIQWMDYQDIAQILRIHIFKKWSMWDQGRPLRPWLHVIITHQITNLIRNVYSNHSRPCLRCAACEGSNLCSIYTTQNATCPLYAHWIKTKKSAHDVKLPVALEFHINEVSERPEDVGDIEKATLLLHEKMKEILKPVEYRVYRYLYIEGKSEEEIGRLLGFKTNEANRIRGYKQISNIKDSIIKKAKKLIYEGEIDF